TTFPIALVDGDGIVRAAVRTSLPVEFYGGELII
ncbi:hypothetical protein CCACVL1_00204, partial [Corchorus capsularis]